MEVRRQFREIKGLMEGTADPDYATCVDICTRGAQKEMIKPALLAILSPLVTGLILGVNGVAGMLARRPRFRHQLRLPGSGKMLT